MTKAKTHKGAKKRGLKEIKSKNKKKSTYVAKDLRKANTDDTQIEPETESVGK